MTPSGLASGGRFVAALVLLSLATPFLLGCGEEFDISKYEVGAEARARGTAADREACDDRDPLRRAFFGDLHVHTSYSSDARMYDVGVDPDGAHRYAFGETVGLPPLDANGEPTRKVKIDRPLDFVGITDHSEFLAENLLCEFEGVSDRETYESDRCLEIRSGTSPMDSPFGKFIMMPYPWRYDELCEGDNSRCLALTARAWQNTIDAAEKWNDTSSRCERTAFVSYEYSSYRLLSNLHRNVIFRNAVVPARPVSYIEVQREWELWETLKETCNDTDSGCEALAIPHNSNISNGRMFGVDYPSASSKEEQAARARLRIEMEPIVEVMQHKGDSECAPTISNVLGANDELCNFEKFQYTNLKDNECYDGPGADLIPHLGPDCLSSRSYVRYALTEGLREEERIGVNPFKFGLMASTDTHNGTAGSVEEKSFAGHLGTADSELAIRASLDPAVYANGTNGPGGLIGIWADENTRDSLFDSMQRKEVFGTSGPRIEPRLFGGWNLPSGLCDDPNAIATAYEQGVAMGGDLASASAEELAAGPTFFVSAKRDPGTRSAPGGLLQRVQIIKGWVDADGELHNEVIDVAGDANNGASVDINTCRVSGPGNDSLCTVWRDPNFDASRRAVYYARAVENPACRYNQWQCIAAGANAPSECANPELTRTLQERAWTSPIWYTPEG